MTVEQVAKKLDKSKWAIYKMIHQRRGIGKDFHYEMGKGWIIDGRKVK